MTIRKPGNSKSTSTRSKGIKEILKRITGHEVFKRISSTKKILEYFIRIFEHESGMTKIWLSVSAVISEAAPPGPQVRELLVSPDVVCVWVGKIFMSGKVKIVVTIRNFL